MQQLFTTKTMAPANGCPSYVLGVAARLASRLHR